MTSMPSSQQIIEYAPQKSEPINNFQTTAYDTVYCTSPTFSYSAVKPTYTEISNSGHKVETTVSGVYNAKLFEAPNREIKIYMTPVYSNAPTSTMVLNEVPSTVATSSTARYSNAILTQQQPPQHQQGQQTQIRVQPTQIQVQVPQQQQQQQQQQPQPATSFHHTPISYVVVQQAPHPNDQANMNGSMATPGPSNQRLSISDAESSVSSLPADLMTYSNRRIRDAQRKRRRRLTETVEEAAIRRAKNLEAKRRRLSRESDEERLRRRQRDAEAKRRRRERESPEQRIRRLARDSERMRRNRRIKKTFRLLRERGVTDPNEVASIIAQEKEHAKRMSNQSTPTNIQIMENVQEFKPEPTLPPTINHMIIKADGQNLPTLANLPPNCNIIVVDQMPCIQQPTTSAFSAQGPTIVRNVQIVPSGQVPQMANQIPQVQQVQQVQVAHPVVETKIEPQILRTPQPPPQQAQILQTPQLQQYDGAKDREERMRIRNRERARRRRANETPEQRAERNRRTAERMRRRRAELNQEKMAVDTNVSPRELSEEEKKARFDEIFECVLQRAGDENLVRELEAKTEQARTFAQNRPNTREISTQTLVETKTYTVLASNNEPQTIHIERQQQPTQYENANRIELHTLQPMSTQVINTL